MTVSYFIRKEQHSLKSDPDPPGLLFQALWGLSHPALQFLYNHI